MYRHKSSRLVTWISPDGRTKNQIDFIAVSEKIKKCMKNCRVFNSAEIGSDHTLLMSICFFNAATKQKTKQNKHQNRMRKLDLERLTESTYQQKFQIQIGGSFEPLLNLETDIDDLYSQFKTATNSTAGCQLDFLRNFLGG